MDLILPLLVVFLVIEFIVNNASPIGGWGWVEMPWSRKVREASDRACNRELKQMAVEDKLRDQEREIQNKLREIALRELESED